MRFSNRQGRRHNHCYTIKRAAPADLQLAAGEGSSAASLPRCPGSASSIAAGPTMPLLKIAKTRITKSLLPCSPLCWFELLPTFFDPATNHKHLFTNSACTCSFFARFIEATEEPVILAASDWETRGVKLIRPPGLFNFSGLPFFRFAILAPTIAL